MAAVMQYSTTLSNEFLCTFMTCDEHDEILSKTCIFKFKEHVFIEASRIPFEGETRDVLGHLPHHLVGVRVANRDVDAPKAPGSPRKDSNT